MLESRGSLKTGDVNIGQHDMAMMMIVIMSSNISSQFLAVFAKIVTQCILQMVGNIRWYFSSTLLLVIHLIFQLSYFFVLNIASFHLKRVA